MFSCKIIIHYQDTCIPLLCMFELIFTYHLREGTRLDREKLYSYAAIHSYVEIYTYTGNTHLYTVQIICYSLRWRHNDHAGVSNHRPHGCLLNRLFRRRSKKTSKLRVTGFCAGNSPGPVISLHKGPVTRKMFPFDDVIMWPCMSNESLCKECTIP